VIQISVFEPPPGGGGGMESVQACEGTPVDRIIFVTIIIIMFFSDITNQNLIHVVRG
jgi:hypothetical protein